MENISTVATAALTVTASVFLLSGCGLGQRMAGDAIQEVPIIASESDPVETFLDYEFALKWHFDYLSWKVATRSQAKETDISREYINDELVFDGRSDGRSIQNPRIYLLKRGEEEIRLFPHPASGVKLTTSRFLVQTMTEVCKKKDGVMRQSSWCATKAGVPLFYFSLINTSYWTKYNKTLDATFGYVSSKVKLIAPKSMDKVDDPAWLNYAYANGFETLDVWRKQLRDAEIKKARELKQKAQEEQEERRRIADREAQEKQKRIAMERAWRQRLERERPIKLFKKGIPVCFKEARGWNGSDYPRFFGYTEGHDENRIRIRVNERQTSRGWMDPKFKPQVIWGHVDDWFICD